MGSQRKYIRMSRRFVNQLKDGDTIEEIFLLSEKQLRANRNADLYLLAGLRDRTGTISGLMWNVTEDSVSHFNPGDYVLVRGKVQLYQGGLQMILTRIDRVGGDDLDASEFQLAASQDIEQLFSDLQSLLESITTPELNQLMQCFLDDEELIASYKLSPAGVKAHHAYQGGLLEHVVTILKAANLISDLYPQLDSDLLLAGVFLHDIGKIKEMSGEASYIYTDEGQLIGHMIIGIEMLNQKMAEYKQKTEMEFPEETALRLKHMIASHHGSYEFGSCKLPMTPEAIALHHLDNLDSKVNEFSQIILEDPSAESHWTPFHPRLGRKLFKGEQSSSTETVD